MSEDIFKLNVQVKDYVQDIETLRAENEALKAENSKLSHTISMRKGGNLELCNIIDTKDAQIRALAEALTNRHLRTCRSFDRPYFECDCGTTEALSAIPSETLELYRLEREVVELSGKVHKLQMEFKHQVYNWTHEKEQELDDFETELTNKLKTLEAHKEGKR